MSNDTPGSARELGQRAHPYCVVCGTSNERGLKLKFTERDDGSIESQFHCEGAFEGYPQQLHGGVIAMLLDGAMTHCLFAQGHTAVTAELTIRYRHPVATNRIASIRAWIEPSNPRLRLVAAELIQDGQSKAVASAKFIGRQPSPGAE